jgi:hypothetical protein
VAIVATIRAAMDVFFGGFAMDSFFTADFFLAMKQ